MDLKTYQLAAARTCPDLSEPYSQYLPVELLNKLDAQLNLSHMVEGMCSELSELSDAEEKFDAVNIAEESADIMWYIANYATFRIIDLETVVLQERIPGTETLSWLICELTDLVKKCVAYNKSIDSIKETYYIDSIIHIIKYNLNGLADNGFEKALQNNIDKLRIRYPEKFNDFDAVNRKLDEERKELEK